VLQLNSRPEFELDGRILSCAYEKLQRSRSDHLAASVSKYDPTTKIGVVFNVVAPQAVR
jgi:hypothetical protein